MCVLIDFQENLKCKFFETVEKLIPEKINLLPFLSGRDRFLQGSNFSHVVHIPVCGNVRQLFWRNVKQRWRKSESKSWATFLAQLLFFWFTPGKKNWDLDQIWGWNTVIESTMNTTFHSIISPQSLEKTKKENYFSTNYWRLHQGYTWELQMDLMWICPRQCSFIGEEMVKIECVNFLIFWNQDFGRDPWAPKGFTWNL